MGGEATVGGLESERNSRYRIYSVDPLQELAVHDPTSRARHRKAKEAAHDGWITRGENSTGFEHTRRQPISPRNRNRLRISP